MHVKSFKTACDTFRREECILFFCTHLASLPHFDIFNYLEATVLECLSDNGQLIYLEQKRRERTDAFYSLRQKPFHPQNNHFNPY